MLIFILMGFLVLALFGFIGMGPALGSLGTLVFLSLVASIAVVGVAAIAGSLNKER